MVLVATAVEPQVAHIHRVEVACGTIQAVARAYGFDGDAEEVTDVFRTLTETWRDTPASSPPPWSGLGADASGCDVSIVLGGAHRELRITAEAQSYPASPQSYWDAAMRLSETLGARYDADLDRLYAVKDVFRSFDADAAGVFWHGAVFRTGRAPWFKVYLHLMSQGRPQARRTTHAALARLGLSHVWPDIERRLQGDEELLFLSFDLVAASQSRVKLYVRHGDATPTSLGSACRIDGMDHSAGVRKFVAGLLGADERAIRRGALTSFHLKPGSDTPVQSATHIRLYPHCGRFDGDLAGRLRRTLMHFDIATAPLDAVTAALARGPLDREEGIHGWASIQWTDDRPIVTVYLSPRLYLGRFGAIGLDPDRMWPSPLA
jgi:hypothetical protein